MTALTTRSPRGILTRLFTEPASLHFGLPCTEDDWQRFTAAMRDMLVFPLPLTGAETSKETVT